MLDEVDDGCYDSSDENLEDIPEDDLNIDGDTYENVDKDMQSTYFSWSVSIAWIIYVAACNFLYKT